MGLPRTGFARGTVGWRILDIGRVACVELPLTGFARGTTRRSWGTRCRPPWPGTFGMFLILNLILTLRVCPISHCNKRCVKGMSHLKNNNACKCKRKTLTGYLPSDDDFVAGAIASG